MRKSLPETHGGCRTFQVKGTVYAKAWESTAEARNPRQFNMAEGMMYRSKSLELTWLLGLIL